MGVTTIVAGNCGSSAADIGRLLAQLQTNAASVNLATLVGHNTIRAAVMGGSFLRPPTTRELDRMKEQVDEAMKAGALGLSTGLIYLPGAFAKTDEIVTLATVAASHGGIYVSHMRDEGLEIGDSIAELCRIAREAGLPAHISHIKASTKAAWGNASNILERIAAARAEGLDVTQDQYVYTASSTGISQLIPETAREGGRDKFRERIANPDAKGAIVGQMKTAVQRNGHLSYDYAVIANWAKNPDLNGLTVPEAAKRRRGSDSLNDQIELILEIESAGGAQGVFHSMNESDLQRFLDNPNTMIASDSGVRKYREGIPHPRGYGNNARVLARYVRELKLLPLEEAIRRMTSLPASVFQIRNRGQIQPGFAADIVVFDPALIQDNAVFEDPHHYATGISWVLVNGVPVVKDGSHTQSRPGQVIRRNAPGSP
jgi:N-acyl-D-amino-acid deacylase